MPVKGKDRRPFTFFCQRKPNNRIYLSVAHALCLAQKFILVLLFATLLHTGINSAAGY